VQNARVCAGLCVVQRRRSGVAGDAISCGAKSDEEVFGGCILLPSCLRASGVLGSGSVLRLDGVWCVGLRTWKRFRTVNGKRTSCVILATAIAASCSRAIHDWSLTRRARCCDVASVSGETRQAASLHHIYLYNRHLFMRPISFRSFSLPSPRYLSAPRCG
jgi:hypothetical protein